MPGRRSQRSRVLAGDWLESAAAGLLTAGLLAAGLLAVGRGPLVARELPRDRDRWLEVKTANFRLWSDAGERRTRDLAGELEQLRSAMGQLLPDLSLTSPCPTYVYVFKDRFAFAPYRLHFQGKPQEVAGYIVGRPWGNYVAIDGDPRTDALHVVRHEYVHYLLHNNYAHLPLWIDEGLAEFYGSFHMVDREARIGEPSEEHLAWLRQNQLIPLRELLAIDQRSKDYHEGVRQGVFYAESWALTHYLILGDPARRAQMSQMFARLRRGTAQPEAFAAAFPGGYEALDQELNVYVHKKIFSYVHLPMAVDAGAKAAVQPVATADILYRLGDLLLVCGPEAKASAAEHFRAALAADPQNGLAVAALGQIEEQDGRKPEALAAYEKAVQLAPGEPGVHYALGRLLVEQMLAGGPAAQQQENAGRAASELGRAVELAPDLGDAWALLGVALLAADPVADRTTAAFEAAHRLAPARRDVTVNLAVAYAVRGRRPEAAAMSERALALGATPADLALVREALLKPEHDSAAKLVAAGKFEEAIPILEHLGAATQRPEVAAQVAAELAQVRHDLARQRFVTAYNEAVAHANGGDIAGAVSRLEALLKTEPEPDDATRARQLLAQLVEHRQRR